MNLCRLGLGPQQAMHMAERLYLDGYLTYPRTETNTYPKNFDLQAGRVHTSSGQPYLRACRAVEMWKGNLITGDALGGLQHQHQQNHKYLQHHEALPTHIRRQHPPAITKHASPTFQHYQVFSGPWVEHLPAICLFLPGCSASANWTSPLGLLLQ